VSVTTKRAAAKRVPARKTPAKKAPAKRPLAKKAAAGRVPAKNGPRAAQKLARYQEMRDFSRTPEPSGAEHAGAGSSFVVQKHKAAAAGVADTVALVARLPVKVKFTNLDKLMYPEVQLRKADVIAYYAAVSSRLLPHVADRPLTLVRCPEGWQGMRFFQKHANKSTPAAIQRVLIEEGGKDEPYMAVHDLDGLLSLPQLGALELHTWGAHVDQVELPDQFVFDLDPDEGLGWDAVVEAALHMRDTLAALELTSFVKTTGGKGLHVVVPVARQHDWETHRAFAKGVADSLAKAHPGRYLTNMRKDLRKGKLFLDYLRNGRGATAVAPYSTRAREGATVATPLSWQELEAGVDPKAFTIRTMMKRLDATSGDPWAAYTGTKQKLGTKQLRAVGVK
jgi:bifunctional non-homologous end joining protein LigD